MSPPSSVLGFKTESFYVTQASLEPVAITMFLLSKFPTDVK